MYSFYVDFHEGAIRVTLKEQCGWLRRTLTGQQTRTVAEAYMDRGQAIQLGSKMLKVANSLGRIKNADGS